MPATLITPVTRFWPTATTTYSFCPAIANKAAPTRGELNAGTNLSGDIAEVSGFTVSSDLIDVPDLGNRFVSKIPGKIQAADSSIKMYADATGVDVRTLLPRDTAGFIVRFDGGDVAGRKCDIFPIKVSALSKDMGTGGDGATIEISLAVTSTPAENVTVPA